jgi:predicted porin
LGSLASADDKTTAMIVGASYNFGAGTLGVGYQQANVDASGIEAKDSGFSVSLSAPLSATTTVALGYATETTSADGFTDGKSKSFGAQVIYSWTKQAAIYAGFVQLKGNPLDETAEGKSTKVATGLRYNF